MRSGIEGLAWPALPPKAALPLHGLLLQLEHSQWLPRAELMRRQLAQVHRLLIHAQSQVPFYGARLAPLMPQIADRPLTPALFRTLPILRRDDLAAAGEALRCRALPSGHGESQRVRIPAEGDRSIEIAHSGLSRLMAKAITLRGHLWHRRDFGGTLALIHGRSGADYPDGRQDRNWGVPGQAGYETGPLVSLDAGPAPEQQLDWLQRRAPHYLMTAPGNLEALARCALEQGVALPGLREVISIAGSLLPDTRHLVHEAWGVPVCDGYSATETGHIALQCPSQEVLHVQSEACLIEVLDDAGGPCRPGEAGRIVATPLQAFATPLIRYDTGARAELGPPCPCGRGLPVLARVLGRPS